jgi:hypothetical protein
VTTWPRWAVTVGEDRSAVLLVRVWLEDGADSFRARLTTPDPSGDTGPDAGLTVALVSSPDAVSRAVRSWLRAFLREP